MAMEAGRAYDDRTTVDKRQVVTTPAMDYLFLSGFLALDLVNTEVVVRGKRYDLFATPEDVAEWWQQALTKHPDEGKVTADTGDIAWSAQPLERIRWARASIRKFCTNIVERQVCAGGS